MADAARTATVHALLIGIDSYPTKPLYGAVNDIDAIQRLLLGAGTGTGTGLGVPVERIHRLASPHPGAPHDTAVPSQPATLANLRAALDALASDAVGPGDRVLIYYAGHGSRAALVTADGRKLHREALVPVDGFHARAEPRLMFDRELDARLAGITARTRNLTLILDCCHAAGAPRPSHAPDRIARSLDAPANPAWREPLVEPNTDPAPAAPTARDAGRALARGLRDCHVVAACLDHELAYEARDDGVAHGLLTRALIRAWPAAPGELARVTWHQIWQTMRAEVEDRQPSQHLWMAGHPAREVLAGPPLDGEPGLSVIRTGDTTFRIDAGSLAGVTADATIAIYPAQPPRFPRLDSPDDFAARIGHPLRVAIAGRAAATAVADAPFDLPPGARGRLISVGAADRLRCAIVPGHATFAARLRGSPLLELVEPVRAQARLELAGDRWVLTDDVHGAGPGEPRLFALAADELGQARAILEHYYHYALPLRMAARATDLPGGLTLEVLRCPDRDFAPAEAQLASWPELASRATATYDLVVGDRLCVRVTNHSTERLRVVLVCAAASGRVQLLGDQVIDAGTGFVFWSHGHLGAPFAMAVPSGRRRAVDRLIAIGYTALAKDLGYLRLDRPFATTKDAVDGPPHKLTAPPEQWTAAQAILDIRAAKTHLTPPLLDISRPSNC